MNTIVLGPNHYNTLGLVWSLGEAGHKITLMIYEGKNLYVTKSKYIAKIVIIHEGDNVIELIKRVASEMDEKPVVLVSNDVDATLLNDHYNELVDCCYFEGGRPDGSVNKYRDKDTGNELALRCGFTLPKNQVIKSSKELNVEGFNYPVLVKANNSVHGGKDAMKKCDTKQEAIKFVNELPSDYFPVQVQEFIVKDYEIMLLGCSLYRGKRVFCPIANKKIRQFPKEVGLGSWSESVEVSGNEDLEQLALKVTRYMKEIEYTGNFSAEFLYSKGKYYFLEINLRNDGTSWLSTSSGFNLPDLVCRSFVDDNVTIEGFVFRKMHYMNIMADIQYVRDSSIKFTQWLKQFNRHTCYSNYNNHDRSPFWNYIMPIVKHSIFK